MILCVDDEPIGLRVRKLLLEHAGYSVMTASSGPEGLEIFATKSISAVVLDYAMPEMNGGEVAAEMKRRNPQIPILMLSAYVDLPEDALQHVDARALKGDSPIALLAELKKLLPGEGIGPASARCS